MIPLDLSEISSGGEVDTLLTKTELRAAMIAARNEIAAEARLLHDAKIADAVLDQLADYPIRTLAVFWPIRGEPDLGPAYAELAAHGVRLALPVVITAGAALGFAAWTPGDRMNKDAMGVPIPVMRPGLSPDALLIPCVGFNAGRVRLGYGGGFYDRTLSSKPRPLAIGVAYSCTQAKFKAEPHDIPLDLIITESSVYKG